MQYFREKKRRDVQSSSGGGSEKTLKRYLFGKLMLSLCHQEEEQEAKTMHAQIVYCVYI